MKCQCRSCGAFNVFLRRCLQLLNFTASPVSLRQTHVQNVSFHVGKKSGSLSDSDSSHGGIPSAPVETACLSGLRLSHRPQNPHRRRRVNQLPLLYEGENLLQPCGKRAECAKKGKSSAQTWFTVLLPFGLIEDFCEFDLFHPAEEDNTDKRKDKKQQREACECG